MRQKGFKTIGIVITYLMAAIGIFLTIYSMSYERKPKIFFEIMSEINVIDVNQPLDDLKIYYQGDDIETNHLNLRTYKIRIKNIGNDDIKQNYYDQDDIWGIKVENGRVVNLEFLNSNSHYLSKSKLDPKVISGSITSSLISFKKVILERQKYFTIEVLVIHKKDNLPRMIPVGKILGVEKIVPVKTWMIDNKTSFMKDLIYGSIFVHIVRLIIYAIILLALFGLYIFLIIPFKPQLNDFPYPQKPGKESKISAKHQGTK